MIITINEDEIKAGCKRFVADQGIGVAGQIVEVHLTAGRGANGFTATVELLPNTTATTNSLSAGVEDPEVVAEEEKLVEEPVEEVEPEEAPDDDEDSLFDN